MVCRLRLHAFRQLKGNDPVLPAVEDAGGDLYRLQVAASVLIPQGAGGRNGGDAGGSQRQITQPGDQFDELDDFNRCFLDFLKQRS